jgi:phage host-nuclease inhibitor protein Gam
MAPKATTAKKLLDLVRLDPPKTREEATALAVETARLDLEREKANLLLAEKIEALKLEFNLHIESLTNEVDRNGKRLAAWAKAHREEEFGSKKSITLGGHRLIFRMGSGKVEFAPGKKADDALNALLSHEDESIAERFVRVKSELNKDAVQAAWNGNSVLRGELEAAGILVVKEESFSFEPDRDAVPDTASVAVGKEVA